MGITVILKGSKNKIIVNRVVVEESKHVTQVSGKLLPCARHGGLWYVEVRRGGLVFRRVSVKIVYRDVTAREKCAGDGRKKILYPLTGQEKKRSEKKLSLSSQENIICKRRKEVERRYGCENAA